jgi:hypothetical protein
VANLEDIEDSHISSILMAAVLEMGERTAILENLYKSVAEIEH